jgi:hypothetical protein
VVFSGYSVFSTNKTDHHDIAELLLKVALNTITEDLLTLAYEPEAAAMHCKGVTLLTA